MAVCDPQVKACEHDPFLPRGPFSTSYAIIAGGYEKWQKKRKAKRIAQLRFVQAR